MSLDPVTLVTVGTKILGGIFGRKAKKAKKRARAATAKIEKLRNLQAKRKFLRNFRVAQATALSQGVASGAGLDSSGVQATLASQRTQATTASFEQEVQAGFARQAGTQLNKADRFGFASQLANLSGDIVNSASDLFPSETPGDKSDLKGTSAKNG